VSQDELGLIPAKVELWLSDLHGVNTLLIGFFPVEDLVLSLIGSLLANTLLSIFADAISDARSNPSACWAHRPAVRLAPTTSAGCDWKFPT
jgi:hypothetical protein